MKILSFRWILLACISVAIVAVNIHYEVIPIHSFRGNDNGGCFRVLTYNVHSKTEGFLSSSQKIAKMIIEEKPDFIFLTEYYEGTDEILQNVLEQHYTYMDRQYRWGANEGDAFYSRCQIDSVQRIKLPNHFSAIYRVQTHKGSDTLAIYCCHLSSNNLKLNEGRLSSLKEGRRLRLVEADTIVNALRREKYPAVVIGDMNDVPFSPTINRIKSAGLKDAWWNGGFGYGSTFHNDWLRLRIDYAFYEDKHLNLQNIDVIGEETWSDHRALVVGFNFK